MQIDLPLARRLVAACFPAWSELPLERVVPGGWDHRTFRLGEERLLRLPSAERYAGQVVVEARWLPRLAPQLPLAIPAPLALGAPACGYPWAWGVYRWLPGADASRAAPSDPKRAALRLAEFLRALWAIDPRGGPAPGARNFHRGGSLEVYASEAQAALEALEGLPRRPLRELFEQALAAKPSGPPRWLHGDLSPANLLTRAGELTAVIDFGALAVGDPACDLTIAWTLFEAPARRVFQRALGADPACWRRARGWALWKAAITLADPHGKPGSRAAARRVLERLLRERPPSS